MKKRIISTLFLIVSLLITGNAYAGIVDTLSGGVDVYQKFIEARHWAAFLAGTILVVLWKALPKLKPTPYPVIANARAFIIYVTGGFCIVLIIYEWWPGVALFLGFIFDLLVSIFEFTKEIVLDFFEYITD